MCLWVVMYDFRQEKRGLASNGGRMTVYGMRSSHSLSLLIFCLLLDIQLSVSSRSYSPSNLLKRWFKLWPIKPAYLLEFTYLPRIFWWYFHSWFLCGFTLYKVQKIPDKCVICSSSLWHSCKGLHWVVTWDPFLIWTLLYLFSNCCNRIQKTTLDTYVTC
jgi:hypothetical protein